MRRDVADLEERMTASIERQLAASNETPTVKQVRREREMAMQIAGSLVRKIIRLEALLGDRFRPPHPILCQLRTDPDALMAQAGLPPDPWQQQVLCSPSANAHALLPANGQIDRRGCPGLAGRSAAASVAGTAPEPLHAAIRRAVPQGPGSVGVGQPIAVIAECSSSGAGQRLACHLLARHEATVRGYTGVSLLIMDEAARVSDSLYYAVRPMLAVVEAGWWRCRLPSASAAGSMTNGRARAIGRR